MKSLSLLRRLAPLTLAALLALAPATASAQARAFHVRANGGSRIQFVSDAPLERTTGTSAAVSGELTLDPAHLESARGSIRVPISSLTTGNGLRDEHLHGDGWLDAARFPDAVFEITRVEGASALSPGEVVRVTLHGRFTIHGRTHEMSAAAQVRWMPASDALRAEGVTGDLIRAQATFSVELPDYDVSVNPLVRLKVSDHISVNVTIRATSD